MDTIFGYVTYIFDDNTVKVHVTEQKFSNSRRYALEENIKITDWEILEAYKGVYDVRISLIYNLLHRKVRVEVLDWNILEGIDGKMTILSGTEKIAS